MRFSRTLLTAAGAIALSLLSACSTTPGPRVVRGGDPNPVAYKPRNPGNVRVKVSLEKQQIYVMEGDRPLLVAATCVGTPAKPTPSGTFKVYKKVRDKRSYSYGYWVKGNEIRPGQSGKPPGSGYRYVGYPMQYWVEFAPLYGFHQGYVWPVPRSHGCLRLHKNVAPKFFALVQHGTPIHIARSHPEDATIGASVGRPNDFNDPDPDPAYMISNAVFVQPPGPLLVEQH